MTDFWAKTPREADPDWGNIQTVLHHLIDVGLAFEELLKGSMAGIGKYLSSAFKEDELGLRALCILAAVHDIGKISPGFQNKVPELVERLKEQGFAFHPSDHTKHDFTGFEFLARCFEPHFGLALSLIYAQAASCHHGAYFSISSCYDEPCDSEDWERERSEHFEKICQLWGIHPDEFPVPVNLPPPQWTVVLAGVISVSDWLGSSLDFPLEADSLDEYVEIRREEIKKRVRESGFTIGSPCQGALSFASLFAPKDEDPSSWKENSTQQALRELTDGMEAPFLALVESPTGVGKTEASLQVYARMARRRTQGLYFALPTMATTNAMFSRIEGFLNRLFTNGETQIKLVQSEARLHKDFRRLLARGTNGSADTGMDEAVRAYEWFNIGSKRGLLAEHAVGTVDQAMLAAMHTKHHFVRLLGLTDKLVVIDEIHAYDTYMQTIIKSLLAWLRALDTPVILLSATLHDAMRRELLAAYAGESIQGELNDGPNVTVWSEKGLESRSIDDLPTRQVGIELQESVDNSSSRFIDEVVQLTLDAVNTGGCVACIINTVDEAQKVFERLDSQLDSDVPRLLLHARFMRRDRNKKEEDVARMFGPDGAARPERAVVVSTQILEQSLDVDFDTMISDLAPIDLLIQRLGRVHRHQAKRPSAERAHPRPTLKVVSPRIDDMQPRASVVPIYKSIVLARTALALAEYRVPGKGIAIPGDDGPLLEAVYGCHPIGDEQLADRLDKWEAEQLGSDALDQFEGKKASLPNPGHISRAYMSSVETPFDLEDGPLTTRLGSESQTVVILAEDTDDDTEELIEKSVRIGHRGLVPGLKELRERVIPGKWKKHWFLRRCVPLEMEEGSVSLEGYRLSYSEKFGLVIEKEEG